MKRRFTLIPADTFQQIQTDAGILLYKFDPKNPDLVDRNDIICPTTGGIQASCTPTYSDMGEDVDNCPANLLELKHLDSWDCSISTTSLGTTPKTIRLALGAADVDGDDLTHIVPRAAVKVTDAGDIWWVGDRADGGMVAILLKRALSTAGFVLQTTKNGKGQTAITLTGHLTVDTQDEVPMEFWSEPPRAAGLTVQSGAGSSGKTSLTVEPAKASEGNQYKYLVSEEAAIVYQNETLAEPWQDWDGSSEITAETGKTLTLAECSEDGKALLAGSVQVTAGEA